MSKGWAARGMRTRAQRKLFAAILLNNAAENGGRCRLAIAGVCTGQAEQVHHTLGVSVTGHDPRYLQPACRACNQHVGDPMASPNPPPRPRTQWL